MSPDYNEGEDTDPVPYADFENPQTLNLYSYVGNNPLRSVDADGHMHQECAPDTFTQQGDSYVLTAGACHDVPDFFDNFRQWLYDHFTTAPKGTKVPSMESLQANAKAQQKKNPIDPLAFLYGVGGAGQVINQSRVRKVLEQIDNTGQAPPGYEGGRTFQNDGRGGGQQLPTSDADGNPIQYKEWDVNAKQPGVNRGAERIVTGSDGSAYYTDNHYSTFTQIR